MIDRSSRKNTVMIFLIIIILGLAGFCSYLMFFKEENNKEVKCKEDKTEEKIIDNISNSKLEIYGKKYDTGAYYICNHKDETDDCKNVLISIETETSNAYIIHLGLSQESSYQYIVYYDNGVKLYDIKDRKSKKIDINLNGNITWLDEGFINNDDDESFYYDLKDSKKTFEKYDDLYVVEDEYSSNQTSPKYLYGKKGNNTVLLEFKTGNVIVTIDNKSYEGIEFKKADSYIIAYLYGTEDTNTVIYNNKGEKKVELKDNQKYEIQGSKIIIYEYEEKKVKEY